MSNGKRAFVRFAGFAGFVLATTLAACGGGGGGSNSPTPVTPTATPAPAIAGVAAVGGVPLANAKIVFSCGCTGQAGTTTANAAGAYTIAPSTAATPAAPSPTYTTVPGRNYIDVITGSTGAQAWDIVFLGDTPAHNHTLNATNTSDQYTTAAALYIFYHSISTTKADAFDTWDFTTIAGWVTAMQTAPLVAETKLLTDITTLQSANASLYPSNGAAWAPVGTIPNPVIVTDINGVDAAALAAGLTTRLPQQCTPAGEPCAVPTP